MKCKQSNDVSILAQKYSPVFKKTAVNSERVTQESYIKLIIVGCTVVFVHDRAIHMRKTLCDF